MKKEVKDTILSTGQKLTFIGEDLVRRGYQQKGRGCQMDKDEKDIWEISLRR